MVDVHCHLNFKAFAKDYDVVIKRAFASGVTKIINVGTKIDSSKRAIELAQQYENLYAIVGIHPHHADKVTKGWVEELEKLAKHPKVVAMGECGMDYYQYKTGVVDPKLQRAVFIRQIELAHKLKLPLQIHNRQAGRDILDVLINHRSYLLDPPGMFHCFSGDLDFLRQVLDLGFSIGFDGNITYTGVAKGETTELKELVKHAPLERIVLETDSPYLAPTPHRGRRNEPCHVIIVGEFIAKLKGQTFEKVQQVTLQNTYELFFPKDISKVPN